MNKPPHFNDVTRRAFETARAILRRRFEDVPLHKRMPYHSNGHTLGVVTRAMKIADVLRLPERERTLVFVASVFHDTVQEFEVREHEDGYTTRVRFSGMNELMSAMDAVSFMQNDPYAFDAYEEAVVSHAIIGTTAFWSDYDSTVIQPLVNEKSTIVSRVLALADLGEAGMDAESFVASGYSLFAEEYIGIVEQVLSAQHSFDIPLSKSNLYRDLLIIWLSRQPAFAKGRRALLTKELAGLEVRWAIKRQLFNQFDASIEGAQKVLEDARKQDFKTLMRRLHPDAFPGMEK